MLRFSIALLMSLGAAVALAAATFLLLASLRGAVNSFWPIRLSSTKLTSKDIYELTRSTITAAGLTAGVFAAVYAYRKQRVEEAASRRADSEHLSSRYQSAADQLGNDKAAVRLAGVYALARLADEWPEQRQTCIDVLCAYYRMHSEGEELATGEREVRETILSSIMAHLDEDSDESWRGYGFNLQRAFFDTDIYLLDGIGEETFFDVTGAVFADSKLVINKPPGGNFGIFVAQRATFKGSTTVEIAGWYKEGAIDFRDAELQGGRLDLTRIRVDGVDLDFQGATFSGTSAYFSGANFVAGHARFDRTVFKAGDVDFNHVTFGTGVASFRYASYESANLTFEDVEGEQPIGLPGNLWQPRPARTPG
ncbi:pentapeptide repeat-containing protein [Micromonospora sp. NPDC047465]|uniref:pentapeptide repeat-containing protein n=1 Tax=Micromonospora sp. NPDC047465 TaxID=3154813 RepID=UPI0033E1A992